MRKTGQLKPCSVCGRLVYRAAWQDRARPTVYCSRECYEVWWNTVLPGYSSGQSHYGWKGGKIERVCAFCSKKFMVGRNRMAYSRKFCSLDCRSKYYSGERNPLWKGGVSSERDVAKASPEYAQWRLAVYERDHFTCVLCLNHCKELHAHHIKRFSDFPELRYDVNNGATLCAPCHKQTCKLEELFEKLIRTRILRDFMSDTRVPLDIVKIKAELRGDTKKLAEMTSSAE